MVQDAGVMTRKRGKNRGRERRGTEEKRFKGLDYLMHQVSRAVSVIMEELIEELGFGSLGDREGMIVVG